MAFSRILVSALLALCLAGPAWGDGAIVRILTAQDRDRLARLDATRAAEPAQKTVFVVVRVLPPALMKMAPPSFAATLLSKVQPSIVTSALSMLMAPP